LGTNTRSLCLCKALRKTHPEGQRYQQLLYLEIMKKNLSHCNLPPQRQYKYCSVSLPPIFIATFHLFLMTQLLVRRTADAFAIVVQQNHRHHLAVVPTTQLWAAKRNKESMAAKRKRRAQSALKRQQALAESTSQLTPSKLDFKTPPKRTQPTQVAAAEPAKEEDDDAYVSSNAKDLVEAQRESVKMLTFVTERIEKELPIDQVLEDLQIQGYSVVDDFLNDDTIVSTMESEAQRMYENNDMTADVTNLGTGEFLVALEGGTDQYPKCPRSIELVVSLTNKLAARLNTQKEQPNMEEDLPLPLLNDRACSRALCRLFDRSALQASLKLLLGDSESVEAALNKKAAAAAAAAAVSSLPFQTVIEKDREDNDKEEDLRKLSLCYYFVPSKWDGDCGGSMTFESSTSDNPSSVSAKRDRLVLWKSDSAAYRKEPFRGTDEFSVASCIELHLLQQQQ
jgi:hypothetical protein